MIDGMMNCLEYWTMQFSVSTIVLRALLIMGIISLTTNGDMVQAQSNQYDLKEDTSNTADGITPNQPNCVKPVRQQNSYPDAGGSQQFFRQGNDKFYFLPEDESGSILQIDRDVETNEIEEQDLQQEPLNE